MVAVLLLVENTKSEDEDRISLVHGLQSMIAAFVDVYDIITERLGA